MQRGGELQDEPLDVARDGADAVEEVGLQRGLARIGTVGPLAVVGEQSGHRDQAEMRAQLLQHERLAAAVEVLHHELLFGNFEQAFVTIHFRFAMSALPFVDTRKTFGYIGLGECRSASARAGQLC